MRMILAAVGVLGISLIGVSGASAIPIGAASIDNAAAVNSPIIKTVAGGVHHHGRYPGCKYTRSYNPHTQTFIGSHGKRVPCRP